MLELLSKPTVPSAVGDSILLRMVGSLSRSEFKETIDCVSFLKPSFIMLAHCSHNSAFDIFYFWQIIQKLVGSSNDSWNY